MDDTKTQIIGILKSLGGNFKAVLCALKDLAYMTDQDKRLGYVLLTKDLTPQQQETLLGLGRIKNITYGKHNDKGDDIYFINMNKIIIKGNVNDLPGLTYDENEGMISLETIDGGRRRKHRKHTKKARKTRRRSRKHRS